MTELNFLIKLIFVILLINVITSTYYRNLKFNHNREFTILQITDLHYGEGIEGDLNSTILQERLIEHVKPDLVVITGDSVSGYSWDGLNTTFYSDLWELWTSPMKKLKVPYAYTFGNHDDQADFNRKQIMDLDATHEYSLSQYNPSVSGASNYFLPIYSSASDNITAIVWLFDTNDETCMGMTDSWGCFEKDEVIWYEQESQRIENHFGFIPKGLAFFHIPLPEYLDMHNWRKSYGSRNEQISCPRKNSNLFFSMLTYTNVNATFCGHDHDNDNGGSLYEIELIYGRKTGYGGYGPYSFQRGARVIKMKEIFDKNSGLSHFTYNHYVIQEDLTVSQNETPTWKGGNDRLSRCAK